MGSDERERDSHSDDEKLRERFLKKERREREPKH